MSDSLQYHGLHHARLSCPSLSPGVCSNSCPVSWWWYLTTSSSTALFSFCLQSFLASGSFTISWLFSSGGQSIGASVSVLAVNIQGWFSRLPPSIINFPPSSHFLHQCPHSHNVKYVRSWSFPKVMLGFPLAHPFLHLHSNFKVVRYDIFLFVQSFIIYFFSRVCKSCGEGLEIYRTSTENVSVQTCIFFSRFDSLIIKGNILKVKIKDSKFQK